MRCFITRDRVLYCTLRSGTVRIRPALVISLLSRGNYIRYKWYAREKSDVICHYPVISIEVDFHDNNRDMQFYEQIYTYMYD